MLAGLICLFVTGCLFFYFVTSDWGWRLGMFECGFLAFTISVLTVGVLMYLLKGLAVIVIPVAIFFAIKGFLAKGNSNSGHDADSQTEDEIN